MGMMGPVIVRSCVCVPGLGRFFWFCVGSSRAKTWLTIDFCNYNITDWIITSKHIFINCVDRHPSMNSAYFPEANLVVNTSDSLSPTRRPPLSHRSVLSLPKLLTIEFGKMAK